MINIRLIYDEKLHISYIKYATQTDIISIEVDYNAIQIISLTLHIRIEKI